MCIHTLELHHSNCPNFQVIVLLTGVSIAKTYSKDCYKNQSNYHDCTKNCTNNNSSYFSTWQAITLTTTISRWSILSSCRRHWVNFLSTSIFYINKINVADHKCIIYCSLNSFSIIYNIRSLHTYIALLNVNLTVLYIWLGISLWRLNTLYYFSYHTVALEMLLAKE